MRWFVEISRLGAAAPNETLCVEAGQWQPALKAARKLGGEGEALSSFSIELLDDGYRAIDASTRTAYLLRKAPADAPLTGAAGAPDAATPKADGRDAKAAKAAPAKDAAQGKGSAKEAAPAKSGAKEPPSSKGSAKGGAKEPLKGAGSAKEDSATKAAAKEPASKGAPKDAAPAKGAAPAKEAPLTKPVANDAARPIEAFLPPFRVLLMREDNPATAAGLLYREYAYAVAPGTAEDVAERFLLARLDEVKAHLATARARKLVNLAVFDHVFEGKPRQRPVATLSWKDWKPTAPEVRFPLRDGPPTMPPVTPSIPVAEPAPPPSAASPAPATLPSQPPAASQPPATSQPSVTTAPVSIVPASSAPASAAPSEKVVVNLSKATQSTPPAEPAPPLETKAAPPAEPPTAAPAAPAIPTSAPPTEPAATKDAADRPAALASVPSAPPSSSRVAPDAKVEAKPSASTAPRAAEAAPKSAPPSRHDAKAASSDRSGKRRGKHGHAPHAEAERGAEPPSSRKRPGSAPPTRLDGEDLISELFESFADLHYLRDSIEGAEFVLARMLEKLPAEVGLVWLFDINRREFVLVRQLGAAAGCLLSRISERAPIPRAAMRTRRAVVLAHATSDERVDRAKWKAVGVEPRSLVCAPVELGGRYLGLIELANPLDGKPFTDGDGHALTYVGQQYAEFVATRGVVLEPEAIRRDAEHAG
jgi:hypothetical protein